ncbi:cytochrome b/b6 domain-containing protein [Sphingomonas cavernae]|uniref:Ni/Fe-hydrogenase 1 b-type cytochrome subunit n=1 Tax=Sphingomonas cavernae TaxID=2320861 RepID=A0A418WT01_9SPHN|nr:cytochrome b/b6 domain-containing protein [Sphingomonas cavernae]RJF94289.1 Ni/Fe-hydrogenase 1 b-type cytochrome subunit [Sphingomonas cavernae]
MPDPHRQFVWDIPIRIFHWSLVGLLAFSWWSAENYRMDWHRLSGQAVLFLLIFRVIWGILGTQTARFRHFLKGPRAIRAWWKGDQSAPEQIGHNPLGGWSVVAMLLALGAQVVTGLFAVDIDGIESGPLSHLVDFEQGRLASAIHDTSFNILLALIALHVAAVVFYLLVRRQNLVGPMLTGTKAALQPAVPVRRGGVVQLLCSLTLAGAAAWWIFADPAF